jgi:hypothetical protein
MRRAMRRRTSLLTVFKDVAPVTTMASSFALDIEGVGLKPSRMGPAGGVHDAQTDTIKQRSC